MKRSVRLLLVAPALGASMATAASAAPLWDVEPGGAPSDGQLVSVSNGGNANSSGFCIEGCLVAVGGVAVTTYGTASGDYATPISLFGNSNGNRGAISGTGCATSQFGGLIISVEGCAVNDGATDSGYTVSGTGNASNGYLSASGTGCATGYITVSGTSCSTAGLAGVSGTGHASGCTAAVSVTGTASGTCGGAVVVGGGNGVGVLGPVLSGNATGTGTVHPSAPYVFSSGEISWTYTGTADAGVAAQGQGAIFAGTVSVSMTAGGIYAYSTGVPWSTMSASITGTGANGATLTCTASGSPFQLYYDQVRPTLSMIFNGSCHVSGAASVPVAFAYQGTMSPTGNLADGDGVVTPFRNFRLTGTLSFVNP